MIEKIEKFEVVCNPPDDLYSDYFITHVEATPFSHISFQKAQSDQVFLIIAYDNKSNIIGVLPFCLRAHKKPAAFLAKMIWLDTLPLIRSDIENRSNIIECFLDKLFDFGKVNKCVKINLSHWNRVEVNLSSKFARINQPSDTIFIDLNSDEEVLYKSLSKGHKYDIKKAGKNNLHITITENELNKGNIIEFLKLREESFKRARIKNPDASILLKSYDFIERLMKTFDLFVTIMVVKFENRPVSGILIFYSRDTAIYYLGGSNEFSLGFSCTHFLLWEAIKYLKNKNIKRFDLGGIPYNPTEDHPAYGVYRFKRGFGGEVKHFFQGSFTISPLKSKLLEYLLKRRKIINKFIKYSDKI